VKIKSFVSNLFWKTAKYYVPNKRPGSHCFFGDPSQQWVTLIEMKKKLVKYEKKNFSQE
jgi:hypothetical protein